MGQVAKNRQRVEIAGPGGSGDVLAPHGFRVAAGALDDEIEATAVGRVARQARQPGPGGEPLPAASLATRAWGAVRVDDHVTGLTGEPVGAPEQAPRRDDPGADPCPQCYDERLVGPNRGTTCMLGHRMTVGVVVDPRREAGALRQQLGQGQILDSAQVRAHVQSTRGIDESRYSNADRTG